MRAIGTVAEKHRRTSSDPMAKKEGIQALGITLACHCVPSGTSLLA